MTDVAAQREARRLKIMKNAEDRLNRLCGKETETESPISKAEPNEVETKQNPQAFSEQNNETKTTSPYNLRHRPNKVSSESPEEVPTSEQKRSSVPYEIVEDPEVPSLAEFLATREAAKGVDGRNQVFNDLSNRQKNAGLHASRNKVSSEKTVEYIRIIGIFLTALLSRWSFTYNLGFNIYILEIFFQSMFFPFLLFEVLVSYVIHAYLQPMSSTAPQGSLLSTALVLCGVKPDLIQIYNKIMSRVTTISNDFFLYIFAFLVCHVIIGY